MRSYTTKEKAKITAGAVASLYPLGKGGRLYMNCPNSRTISFSSWLGSGGFVDSLKKSPLLFRSIFPIFVVCQEPRLVLSTGQRDHASYLDYL